MSLIAFVDADEAFRERIGREWGQVAARHMHTSDGFSIAGLAGDELVGLLAVVWRDLPPPLSPAFEAYIDIIEVHREYRRQGIASQMVRMAVARARAPGAYQVRAWSSDDKTEAIPMWRALGFGLCPATVYPREQPVRGFFVTYVVG